VVYSSWSYSCLPTDEVHFISLREQGLETAEIAKRLVQRSVHLTVVKEFLRHHDINMTMRYAQLNPEQNRSAVELLDNLESPRTSNGPAPHKVPVTDAQDIFQALVQISVVAINEQGND
jgi:hypothetical protein